MAINIQPIIDELISRLALADSSDVTSDQIRLEKLVKNAIGTSGVLEYRTVSQLPKLTDSASIGYIAFVKDSKNDKYGTFYTSTNFGWERITLATDSDEDNIIFPTFLQWPGETYGYGGGGSSPTFQSSYDKFPFATNNNGTNVGSLTVARNNGGSASSKSHGYGMAGSSPGITNIIDKFSFATDGNFTDVGDLPATGTGGPGVSSETNGYYLANAAPTVPPVSKAIQKFPFSSDGNALAVGDLPGANVGEAAGVSSWKYNNGYTLGGNSASNPFTTMIQKFSFSNELNGAYNIGYLSVGKFSQAGISAFEYGYVIGGSLPALTNKIEKFPFAAEGDAIIQTGVIDTTGGTNLGDAAGCSSQIKGYSVGGTSTGVAYSNVIMSFPFAVDLSASDVGDLTVARRDAFSWHI